jgi:hypothetical protein
MFSRDRLRRPTRLGKDRPWWDVTEGEEVRGNNWMNVERRAGMIRFCGFKDCGPSEGEAAQDEDKDERSADPK